MLDKTLKAVKGGILQTLWFEQIESPFDVNLTLYQLGRDYLAVLAGGEAHLGAVSFEGSLRVPPPHKEGPLAQNLEKELAKLLDSKVAVIAGIHFDGLTPQEVLTVVQLANQLIERLKKDLLSR